ncbi:MAG: GntR family transcriptional regulator [Pirellulaceae bacterium]
MQLHVSPNDGVPIYQQVVNQIKYLVASGRLREGDQLLPVRKLAEELIVNPNTVARAYRELESEGVVESRRGAGVFVSAGVSRLAKREQNKILSERVDMLLAEAAHMNVDVEAVIKLVRQRSQQMR